MRIQIKLLKYHAHGGTVQLGLILIGQKGAVNPDLTGGGLLQKIHTTHRCGFARAGRPDDHQLFALCNFQIHVLQHMEIAEILVHIYQFDHSGDSSL